MAGLIGRIEGGDNAQDGDVIFLHTGDYGVLFAYEDQFGCQPLLNNTAKNHFLNFIL